jgi:hypothetical protein
MTVISPERGRGQVTVKGLTNGFGRNVVERAALQIADLSSRTQSEQGIDEFPQQRASGLTTAPIVGPYCPRIRCDGGRQATSESKQVSPR